MAGIIMAVASLIMTPEDMDQLTLRVIDILKHDWPEGLSPEEHREDHHWTAVQREKERIWIARQEAITRAALQWSVVGILTAIAALVVSWWKGNHGG